jgi:hypothetical protein
MTTIEQMIIDKALAYLAYDDANPNVGMGMWHSTAYQFSLRDVNKLLKEVKSPLTTNDVNESMIMAEIDRVRNRR